MRKASPGVLCVLLGVVLLLAALGLYGYNRWEDAQAGAEAQTVVQDLQEKVVEQTQSAASAPAIDYSSLDPDCPWWSWTATNMWALSPSPPLASTCR